MSLIEASHHYHVYKETFVQFEQCLGRGEEKAEIWTKPILSSCKPQQKPLLSNCWKMLPFIRAAHSAGGTPPPDPIHYRSLHSQGTTAIPEQPVPSVFNDGHMRI